MKILFPALLGLVLFTNSSFASPCESYAAEWAVRDLISQVGDSCRGAKAVLVEFRRPAPNALDYTFAIDCAGKSYRKWVPMHVVNGFCEYAGE